MAEVKAHDGPHDTVHDETIEAARHVDEKHSDVLGNKGLMEDAVDGENREHAQTLWEAAKEHPKACVWAFIMCFTIVSFVPRHTFLTLDPPSFLTSLLSPPGHGVVRHVLER